MSLPPTHPANPTTAHINLINPTAADGAYVRTEYAYIRTYAARLHARHTSDVDLFLHLGMAGGWDFVSVERRAYKQGFSSSWGGGRRGGGGAAQSTYYMLPDAKGETVLDAPVCPWGDEVPIGLAPDLDIDAIVESARRMLASSEPTAHHSDEDGNGDGDVGTGVGTADSTNTTTTTTTQGYVPVKPHHEPGGYGCGFMCYESLANKYVRGTKGDVVFCHVPGETDPDSLARACNTVMAIIGATVEDIMKKRGGN